MSAHPPWSQQHGSSTCTEQKQISQIHYRWGQAAAKKATWQLWARTQSKKAVQPWQWSIRTKAARFALFLLNHMSLRDLSGVGTKWKNNIIKNTNQVSSFVTTRTWFLSTQWTITWSSIGIRMKKLWWFPFVWMVHFLIQCAWMLHLINKDKGNESLALIAFRRHFVNVIFWNIQRKAYFPQKI